MATVAYQEIKKLDGPNVEKFIPQVRTHQLNILELFKETRNKILALVHSVLTQHVEFNCADDPDWDNLGEDTKLVACLKGAYPLQRKDKLDTAYRALLRNIEGQYAPRDTELHKCSTG